MRVGKRLILILSLLILGFFNLFAATYRIEGYDIDIIGRTKESAVRRIIGNDEGIEFQSTEELQKAIEAKRQKLLDLRIMKSVEATWTEGMEQDGYVPVRVHFSIVGAFSFIAFPSAAYDSNYGFFAQFYVEDQNFIGTTGKLKFSISLKENDNVHELKNSLLTSYLEVELPFGKSWNMRSRLSLELNGKDNETSRVFMDLALGTKLFESGSFSNTLTFLVNPQSKLRTGLRKVLGFIDVADLAFNDSFSINLRNVTAFTDDSTARTDTQTTLTGSYNLEKLTGLNLTTALMLEENTWGSTLASPTLYLKLISQDYRILWHGDFRSGYNYYLEAYLNTKLETLFKGDIRLFNTPLDWLELSTRLVFRHDATVDNYRINEFTGYMRGIKDDNALIHNQEIHDIAVLNLDTKFHVLTIPKLIRGYLGPFIDLGYVAPDHFLATVGLEMVLILDEWPGSPGRISIGKSLTDPDEYEVTVYAYFFY